MSSEYDIRIGLREEESLEMLLLYTIYYYANKITQRTKEKSTHTHTQTNIQTKPSNKAIEAQQTRNISGRVCNTIEIHIKLVGYVNKFSDI